MLDKMSIRDNTEREISGRIESSTAKLESNKEKHLIRIVNGSDEHIAFAFRLATANSDKKITVRPDRGVIQPRSYLIASIESHDRIAQAARLGLFYWRTGSHTKNSRRFGGLVHIDMAESKTASSGHHRENSFWISIRVLRSMFLIALITYNIILIKLNLYDYFWLF